MAQPSVRDVASLALVKLGVTPVGEIPDAASLTLAVDALQSSLSQLLTGALGRLYDVAVTTDATAFPGLRIRCDAPGLTITLPTSLPYDWYFAQPGDYADMPWLWWGVAPQTYDTLPPRNMDCAVVIDFGTGESHTWVYNAYAGKWTDIANLSPNDPFPLAPDMKNGFAAMVAMDLMDVFPEQSQMTVSSLTTQTARVRSAIATKYDNRQQSVCGEFY